MNSAPRVGRCRLLQPLDGAEGVERHLGCIDHDGAPQPVVVELRAAGAAGAASDLLTRVRVAEQLNHPALVQILDWGRAGGRHYVVVEQPQGVDLTTLIEAARARRRRFPHGVALLVGEQLCAALDYLQARVGEEHLSLPLDPSAIRLSRDGTLRLAITALLDPNGDGPLTSPPYRAPELAEQLPSPASQTFTLGAVLYEVAVGWWPRSIANPDAVIPPPRDIAPELPLPLAALLQSALDPAPEHRFQKPAELAQALGECRSRLGEDYGEPQLAQLIADLCPGPPDGEQGIDLRAGRSRPPTGPARLRSPPEASQQRDVIVVSGRSDTPLSPGLRHLLRLIAFKHRARPLEVGQRSVRLLVGLPVSTAHDAERAARLALTLAEASKAAKQPGLSVGLSSGRALVTHATTPCKVELEEDSRARGDRLAGQAMPGEVLVDQVLQGATQGAFLLDPVAQADRLQPTYRLVQPLTVETGATPSPRLPVVGRELELRRLHDLFGDVFALRRSTQVALVGPPGIGKRSVADGFLQELDPPPATVIRIDGRRDSAIPYGLVRQLLYHLLEAEGIARRPPGEIRRVVDAAVASLHDASVDERAAAFDTICYLLGLQPGGFPRDRRPAQRELQVLAALQHLLIDRGRKGSVVLMVGNLERADPHSLPIVAQLAHQLPGPIFAVFSARSGHTVQRTLDAHEVETIDLGPLEASAVEELLERRLADKSIATAIERRAGGHPLLLDQWIEALNERGILVLDPDDDGRLHVTGKDLPPTEQLSLEQLLRFRLEDLGASERALLSRLAAVTESCSEELVRFLGTDEALDLLQALIDRKILARDERKGYCRFVHEAMREVAHADLGPAERARVHQQLASWFAGRPDGVGEARVARHLEWSDDRQLALQTYIETANRAQTAQAEEVALLLYQRALELAASPSPVALEIHAARESLYEQWRQHLPRLREIRKMLQIAEALGDAASESRAGLLLAELLLDVRRPKRALAAIEAAEAGLQRIGALAPQLEANRLRALGLLALGEAPEARAVIERALDLCGTRALLLPQRASLLVARAEINRRDQLRAALSDFGEALVIYHRLDLAEQELETLDRLGQTAFALGAVSTALSCHRQALRLARSRHSRVQVAQQMLQIGRVYADLDERGHALPHLGKALQICEALGETSLGATTLLTIGELHLRSGNTGAAWQLLEQSRQLAEQLGNRSLCAHALIALAHRALADDETDRALELARQARTQATMARSPAAQAHAWAVEGWVHRRQGGSEAAACAREAIALARRHDIPRPSTIYLLHARCLRSAGEHAEARAVLAEARGLDDRRARQRRLATWHRFIGVPALPSAQRTP